MTTIYTSKKKEFAEATKEGKYRIRSLSKDFFKYVIEDYIKTLKDYDTLDYEIKKDGTLVFTAYKYDLSNVINPDEFQTIPITSEMKSKYPSLKKYKELIISGKKMKWDVAMNYAKKNGVVLPDKIEGKDIGKMINDSGPQRNYFYFWTREEIDSKYMPKNQIVVISSDGYSYATGKFGNNYCLCLR